MLEIIVPLTPEGWDEEKQEFVEPKTKTLRLEHSLVSLSKWESKWRRPFISKKPMSDEETIDYIKCMTITQNVDPDVYEHLTRDNIKQVIDYIDAPMTATTFSQDKSKSSREVVTAEIIYHWMIALQIPPEYRKWHLNQLLTLIRVCNIKNAPPEKMSRRDVLSRNRALNEARKKRLNTKG